MYCVLYTVYTIRNTAAYTLYAIYYTRYAICTIRYTLCTIHDTPYMIHYTLGTIYTIRHIHTIYTLCDLYTRYAILNNDARYTVYVHYTLHTIRYTLYTVRQIHHALYDAGYTIRYTLHTIHDTPCTIRCTLYAVHHALYTIYTMHNKLLICIINTTNEWLHTQRPMHIIAYHTSMDVMIAPVIASAPSALRSFEERFSDNRALIFYGHE